MHKAEYTAVSSCLDSVVCIYACLKYTKYLIVTVVYDYLLILGFEVKIIWPRKFWFLKFWYFAVRYSSLGFNVVIIFFYFGNLSPEAYILPSVSMTPLIILVLHLEVLFTGKSAILSVDPSGFLAARG
jgi:hypothetical protein